MDRELGGDGIGLYASATIYKRDITPLKLL